MAATQLQHGLVIYIEKKNNCTYEG